MNQQFIQSLSIDWNKIEDDSYLREIEAINKLKEVVFELRLLKELKNLFSINQLPFLSEKMVVVNRRF